MEICPNALLNLDAYNELIRKGNLVFINRVANVNWPPFKRLSRVDVMSVRPSSERRANEGF